MPNGSKFNGHSVSDGDDARYAVATSSRLRTKSQDALYLREGELMAKLHDSIHSPMGDGIAVLVEELHSLVLRSRSSL